MLYLADRAYSYWNYGWRLFRREAAGNRMEMKTSLDVPEAVSDNQSEHSSTLRRFASALSIKVLALKTESYKRCHVGHATGPALHARAHRPPGMAWYHYARFLYCEHPLFPFVSLINIYLIKIYSMRDVNHEILLFTKKRITIKNDIEIINKFIKLSWICS